MHRIDTLNAVPAAPATETPGTPGWFDKGDPEVPREATHFDQDWANAVQGELTAAIEAAGLALDKNDRTQLLAAWPILMRDKLYGFRASQQNPASMSVDVGQGSFFDLLTGGLIVKGTQFPAAFVAPTANPRNDIIHIDARTGVIGVTAGTEAASPTDPALAFNNLPVVRVRLAVATTEITAAEIDDIRFLVGLGSGTAHLPIQTMEESPEIALVAGNLRSFTHGLSTVTAIQAWLRCVTADSGYAAGDEVQMPYSNVWDTSGGGANWYNAVINSGATVHVMIGPGGIKIANKTNGAWAAINYANWMLVFRVFGS